RFLSFSVIYSFNQFKNPLHGIIPEVDFFVFFYNLSVECYPFRIFQFFMVSSLPIAAFLKPWKISSNAKAATVKIMPSIIQLSAFTVPKLASNRSRMFSEKTFRLEKIRKNVPAAIDWLTRFITARRMSQYR